MHEGVLRRPGRLDVAATPQDEIDRALRNMAGFRREHFPRQPGGSRKPSMDHARVLAEKFGEVKRMGDTADAAIGIDRVHPGR